MSTWCARIHTARQIKLTSLLQAEWDGSWTAWQVGLLDEVSEQVYAALAHHVSTSNDKRYKTVGLWSLQLTAQAVLRAIQNLDHF